MSLLKWIGAGVVMVLAATGVWAQAQTFGPFQAQPPTVISGTDLGFRVEGRKGNTPVGTLVVRVNGQWVEAEFAGGVKSLTAR